MTIATGWFKLFSGTMIRTTYEILKRARANNYAVGSFNTSNVDVMRAIIEAASELSSPVIVETSEGEMAFDGPRVMVAAFQALSQEIKIPVVLHLDHGKNFETIKTAISSGYTSVHVDASILPYSENLALTQAVVALAHPLNIFVEGELGHVPGTSEAHELKIKEVVANIVKTDPTQAVKFVKETGIDCLAASYGNLHGLYQDEKKLDLALIKTLRGAVDCFLSLHGSSGIKAETIRSAIEAGINKINVNTELRVAYIQGIHHQLDSMREEIKPYKVFPPALNQVKEVVKQKIMLFGSNGQADY